MKLLLMLLMLVSCGKDDLIPNLTNDLSQGVEEIGQIPRELFNGAIGTKSTTTEDLKILEEQIEELRLDLANSIVDMDDDLSHLREELVLADAEMSNDLYRAFALERAELEYMISVGDSNNLKKIRRLNRRFRRLRKNLRNVRRNLDNLEVVCDYLDLGSLQLATYCTRG